MYECIYIKRIYINELNTVLVMDLKSPISYETEISDQFSSGHRNGKHEDNLVHHFLQTIT
jgi:hypothetical protein